MSTQKTEMIRDNKMDAFQKQLMKERKQIQAINQLEEKRILAVDQFFTAANIQSTDKTVTKLLTHLDEGQEKNRLELAVSRLIDIIVKIRDVEKLNKELIQHSLEFVQLSLEMFQPSEQRVSYGQNKTSRPKKRTSVFDSKA